MAHKGRADGNLAARVELAADILQRKTAFAHAAVPKQHKLDSGNILHCRRLLLPDAGQN